MMAVIVVLMYMVGVMAAESLGPDAKRNGLLMRIRRDADDIPSLLYLQGHGGKFEKDCAAVLVAKKWALTARRCVDGTYTKRFSLYVKATRWSVKGGVKDRTAKGSSVSVEKIFFDTTNKDADIALLKLVNDMSNITPATIAPAGSDFEYKQCTGMGWWGSRYSWTNKVKKQKLYVRPNSDRVCRKHNWFKYRDSWQFCARKNSYNRAAYGNVCMGGGSPLVCEKDGVKYLYGLGQPRGQGCMRQQPMQYLYVQKFRGFIDRTIKANP